MRMLKKVRESIPQIPRRRKKPEQISFSEQPKTSTISHELLVWVAQKLGQLPTESLANQSRIEEIRLESFHRTLMDHVPDARGASETLRAVNGFSTEQHRALQHTFSSIHRAISSSNPDVLRAADRLLSGVRGFGPPQSWTSDLADALVLLHRSAGLSPNRIRIVDDDKGIRIEWPKIRRTPDIGPWRLQAVILALLWHKSSPPPAAEPAPVHPPVAAQVAGPTIVEDASIPAVAAEDASQAVPAEGDASASGQQSLF